MQTTSLSSKTRALTFFSAFSGILLVAGTCIGAGMLALPVVTGAAGFLPALAINFLCCLFMMSTGLLFLEATLWMKDGANVLSMARHFFGPWGKFLGGISFLFLYYCFEVSYSAGGSPLFAKIIETLLGIQIRGVWSHLLFGAVFSVVVFLGTSVLNRLNLLLMAGLFASYLMLIWLGATRVNETLLQRSNWTLSLAAAPTLFGAYGYHNLLPSMATYMKRNARLLRLSIIGGTLVPFLIYSLWQWIVIGTLSLDQIQEADALGVPITQAFHVAVGHPWLSTIGLFFGFFALTTSFLGVSLSMVDFLADGLRIQREGWTRLGLCLTVFVPPALIAAINPHLFIEAIGLAGGFGEAILNGLFPIGMVWIGRYQFGYRSDWKLPGSRFILVLLSLITLMIIGIEIQHLL